jgi:predicted SprT family Zn-dependent metalloprotease
MVVTQPEVPHLAFASASALALQKKREPTHLAFAEALALAKHELPPAAHLHGQGQARSQRQAEWQRGIQAVAANRACGYHSCAQAADGGRS